MRDDVTNMISQVDIEINKYLAGNAESNDKQQMLEWQKEKDRHVENYVRRIASADDDLAREIRRIQSNVKAKVS